MAEALHLDPRQRRQVRRTVTVLTIIALGLYFGFIVYSVLLHGHH